MPLTRIFSRKRGAVKTRQGFWRISSVVGNPKNLAWQEPWRLDIQRLVISREIAKD